MKKKHHDRSSPRKQPRQARLPPELNYNNNNNNSGQGGHREDHRPQRPPSRQNNPPPMSQYNEPMREALYNEYTDDGTRGLRQPSVLDDRYESYEGDISHLEYRASNRQQFPNTQRKCNMPPPNHPCFEDDRRAEVLMNSRGARQNDARGQNQWNGGQNNNGNNFRPSDNTSGFYDDQGAPLANRMQNMYLEDRGPNSGRGERYVDGQKQEVRRQDMRSYDGYQGGYQQQQQPGGYGGQNQNSQGYGGLNQQQSGYGALNGPSQAYGRQDQQQGFSGQNAPPQGYYKQEERQGFSGQNPQQSGHGGQDQHQGGYGGQNQPHQGFGSQNKQHEFGRRDHQQGGYGRQDQHQYGHGEQNQPHQGHGRQNQHHGGQNQHHSGHGRQNNFGRRNEQHGDHARQNQRGHGFDRNPQPGPKHVQPCQETYNNDQWQQQPNNSGNSTREQHPPRHEAQHHRAHRGPQNHVNQGPDRVYEENQGGSQQQWNEGGSGYQRSNSDQAGFENRSHRNYEPEPSDRQGYSNQWNQGGSSGSGFEQNRHDFHEESSNRSYQGQGTSRQANQRRQEEPNFDNMVVRGNRFERYAQEKKKREEDLKNAHFDESYIQRGNRFDKGRKHQKGGGGRHSEPATTEERAAREPIQYRNGQCSTDYEAPSSQWRMSGSWDSDSVKQKDSQQRDNGFDDEDEWNITGDPKKPEEDLEATAKFEAEQKKKKEIEKRKLLTDREAFRNDLLERMSHLDGMQWDEEMEHVEALKASGPSTPEEQRGFEIHPVFTGHRPTMEEVFKVILRKPTAEDAETPILGATSDQEDDDW